MTRAELIENGTLEIIVNTACVLERAAEHCEGGWCQQVMGKDENGTPSGANGDATICWCASGAIIHAMHRIVGTAASAALWNGTEWEATQAVERAIRESWPDTSAYDVIPTWNDRPERTQAEVIATLGAAAQELRGWLGA